MTDLTEDIARERLLIEMQRAGLIEPGDKIRFRLTPKGDAWGGALYGVKLAMEKRGEPFELTRSTYLH